MSKSNYEMEKLRKEMKKMGYFDSMIEKLVKEGNNMCDELEKEKGRVS